MISLGFDLIATAMILIAVTFYTAKDFPQAIFFMLGAIFFKIGVISNRKPTAEPGKERKEA